MSEMIVIVVSVASTAVGTWLLASGRYIGCAGWALLNCYASAVAALGGSPVIPFWHVLLSWSLGQAALLAAASRAKEVRTAAEDAPERRGS